MRLSCARRIDGERAVDHHSSIGNVLLARTTGPRMDEERTPAWLDASRPTSTLRHFPFSVPSAASFLAASEQLRGHAVVPSIVAAQYLLCRLLWLLPRQTGEQLATTDMYSQLYSTNVTPTSPPLDDLSLEAVQFYSV